MKCMQHEWDCLLQKISETDTIRLVGQQSLGEMGVMSSRDEFHVEANLTLENVLCTNG
jgi:hypothetical protein